MANNRSGQKADVFAAVAAYEDPWLVQTLETMLDNPGASVRVAVCLQSDDAELAATIAKHPEVDLLHLPRAAARGACWPRAVCQSMYEGEPWFFQCDSHMVFEPNWAADCMAQSEMVEPRHVLTTYAQGHDNDIDPGTGLMSIYHWGDDGPHCAASQVSLDMFAGRPLPARFLSAHLLWAPGSFVVDVPYDPQFYFSGEEFSLAIRAWTHGYDLWAPAATICKHRYGPRHLGGRRVHWNDDPDCSNTRSEVTFARVAELYGWPSRGTPAGDIGVYGLGNRRTLAEFQAWALLDIANRRFIPDDDWRAWLRGEREITPDMWTHGEPIDFD